MNSIGLRCVSREVTLKVGEDELAFKAFDKVWAESGQFRNQLYGKIFF
jgi:hypothetical protein